MGIYLSVSFDTLDKHGDELTIEQIIYGPPEYSQWEDRNSQMMRIIIEKFKSKTS